MCYSTMEIGYTGLFKRHPHVKNTFKSGIWYVVYRQERLLKCQISPLFLDSELWSVLGVTQKPYRILKNILKIA